MSRPFPHLRRRAHRELPAARAALRLCRQRQGRGARHRAHRAHRNRRSDLAHRPAAHRANCDAGARRRAGHLILYAIPTPLGGTPQEALPAPALATIRTLRDFVVENAKSARAFLAAAGCQPRELALAELNEHTAPEELPGLLQPLRDGRALGLLSEAGCPAIADPGAALVESCASGTRLCIAAGLTLPSESIRTQAIAEWRRSPPSLGKRPAVFLLLART